MQEGAPITASRYRPFPPEKVSAFMASREPQVGEHYRSVGSVSRNAVWVITEIVSGRDGIDHARLASVQDATQRKTLAVTVIADTRRFILEK